MKLLLLISMMFAFAQDKSPSPRIEAGTAFVERLQKGEFKECVEQFDSVMQSVLPAEKLAATWEGITTQYGPLKKQEFLRIEKKDELEAVLITCEFEKGKLVSRVVFTKDQKITGLFFGPAGQYKSPDYVDSTKFETREVTVGTGFLNLKGSLTVPIGDGPFPAVILVHGSGPNDRDETIGPNKPFRDIAEGLSSRGIAVLRYEKRTYAHPIEMSLLGSSITVKQETNDDAGEAVKLLLKTPAIDPKLIFVLGHSLGGNQLPRIAEANPSIAGLISLAGSTRPMEDLIEEQVTYLLSLNDQPSDEEKASLETIKQQVALVKSDELKKDTPASKLPLGVPASYWLDLRGYNPAELAKSISKPWLFLQGERDYQVTLVDLNQWKSALSNHEDATFRTYPKLNHVFIAGEGRSTATEYTQPGNVASEVILDIANWIDQRCPKGVPK